MSSAVFKYPIPFMTDKIVSVMMPHGAQILSVQLQNDEIVAWALVDAKAPTTDDRTFYIVGTGWKFDEWGKFVHRATIQSGPTVWHVFEVVNAGA